MHDAGTSCLAKLHIRTPSTPRRINLSIPAFVPRTHATSLLSAQSGPARCVRRCPLSGESGHESDIFTTLGRAFVPARKTQRKGNCMSTNDTYLAVFRG